MRTTHEAVVGQVESWRYEEGWGVLRTPSGLSVFCHFSHVDLPGYRTLTPGTSVYFDYEVPGQDGCDARVRTAARPAAASGENLPLTKPVGEAATESSYGSGLRFVWDDDVNE